MWKKGEEGRKEGRKEWYNSRQIPVD